MIPCIERNRIFNVNLSWERLRRDGVDCVEVWLVAVANARDGRVRHLRLRVYIPFFLISCFPCNSITHRVASDPSDRLIIISTRDATSERIISGLCIAVSSDIWVDIEKQIQT